MSNINPDIFKNFCSLSQKLQQVEKLVKKGEVSFQNRENFHRELEKVHAQLDALKFSAKDVETIAQAQFSAFDSAETTIVSLYREIEERFEAHEVTIIAREALCLSDDLEHGKMQKVAKHVDALKYNIQFLLNHRRPSLKNRKIVHLAQELATRALAILNGELNVDEAVKLHLILVLRQLLQKSLKNDMGCAELDIDLMEEFFEVAHLFYQRKRAEGRLRLSVLMHLLTKDEKDALSHTESSHEHASILLRISQRFAGGFSDEISLEEVFGHSEQKAEIISLLVPA